jgi:hypothetical protein
MSRPRGTTPTPVVEQGKGDGVFIAHAGGGDEDTVALALLHHLGVAGDHGHAGLARRRRHRLHHALEVGERITLFDDEAGRQVQRPRAQHGDVVDGAVHGQRTEVATAEEDGAHDMAVAGHDEPAAFEQLGGRGQQRAVVALAQELVVEGGGKQLLDQLRGGATAGAVVQVDTAVLEVDRALVARLGCAHAATFMPPPRRCRGSAHSCSARRRRLRC